MQLLLLIGNQTPKSHFTVFLGPLLLSTVIDQVQQGKGYETLRFACRVFTAAYPWEPHLRGMRKEMRQRRKLNHDAVTIGASRTEDLQNCVEELRQRSQTFVHPHWLRVKAGCPQGAVQPWEKQLCLFRVISGESESTVVSQQLWSWGGNEDPGWCLSGISLFLLVYFTG